MWLNQHVDLGRVQQVRLPQLLRKIKTTALIDHPLERGEVVKVKVAEQGGAVDKEEAMDREGGIDHRQKMVEDREEEEGVDRVDRVDRVVEWCKSNQTGKR